MKNLKVKLAAFHANKIFQCSRPYFQLTKTLDRLRETYSNKNKLCSIVIFRKRYTKKHT